MNESATFTVKPPASDKEWATYHEIRKIDLFAPINIEYDLNHPSLHDSDNYHYLFFKSDEIIGTLQIEKLSEQAFAIRTLAIKDPFKNKGYGSILLSLAEEIIKNFNCDAIYLHANPKAVSFYEKNGYRQMEFPNDKAISASCIDMGKFL